MKKYVNITLCDTTASFDYADYVEECEINGVTPDEDGSYDFYEWQGRMQSYEYEDLMTNLSYASEADVPCVITGTLGLWNGTHEIQHVYMSNLKDAISKCVGSCNDCKVVLTEGHVEVYGYHHDGTNCFEIYKLSKKGQDVPDIESVELKDYHLAKWHSYLY